METIISQIEIETQRITAGKKISKEKAISSQKRYWDSVLNNTITSEDCPKQWTGSLRRLKQYLEEIEQKFEQMDIAEEDRGVIIFPCHHENEERFNIMFTACLKDEKGITHHFLNNNIESYSIDWDDFGVFNTFMPVPPPPEDGNL